MCLAVRVNECLEGLEIERHEFDSGAFGRMPKLYVPQGLSSRAHSALVQRLRTFMASAYSEAAAQAQEREEASNADLARNAAGQAEVAEQPDVETEDMTRKMMRSLRRI